MICERFKKQRLKLGLNQVEFAKVFNVTKQTVSNWESGKRKPDAEMIRKIAAYFGVTTDYLLGADNFNIVKEKSAKDDEDKELDAFMELYDQLNEDNKEIILNLIKNLLDK